METTCSFSTRTDATMAGANFMFTIGYYIRPITSSQLAGVVIVMRAGARMAPICSSHYRILVLAAMPQRFFIIFLTARSVQAQLSLQWKYPKVSSKTQGKHHSQHCTWRLNKKFWSVTAPEFFLPVLVLHKPTLYKAG